MAQVFLCLIAASLIPLCIPLTKREPLSSKYWKASCIAALSPALQAIFVVSVEKGALTLDYSIRFAAIGVPACILAIVLAIKANDRWRTDVIVTSSIGLFIWAILVTLH